MSSCEKAGEFCWPPALVENPGLWEKGNKLKHFTKTSILFLFFYLKKLSFAYCCGILVRKLTGR